MFENAKNLTTSLNSGPEPHVGVQLCLGRDGELVVVVVEAEVAAADATAGQHLQEHGGFELNLVFNVFNKYSRCLRL